MENNKLIAEFMGAVKTDRRVKVNPFYMFKDFSALKLEHEPDYHGGEYSSLDQSSYWCLSEMKFHESWDWLIPVVDKIYSSEEYQKYLYSKNTTFWSGIEINTKFIECTYEEVIEFIKWYNENNLNENQKLGQSTII